MVQFPPILVPVLHAQNSSTPVKDETERSNGSNVSARHTEESGHRSSGMIIDVLRSGSRSVIMLMTGSLIPLAEGDGDHDVSLVSIGFMLLPRTVDNLYHGCEEARPRKEKNSAYSCRESNVLSIGPIPSSIRASTIDPSMLAPLGRSMGVESSMAFRETRPYTPWQRSF